MVLWQKNLKFRYLAIGAWNTLAGFCIFAGLYAIFGELTNYIAIAVFSHVIAVTQSFATQRKLVFRSSGNCLAEYARFNIAHLGSLGIGLVLLPLMVEIIHISPIVAQGLSTVLIVVGSYFIHRHFTFKKSKFSDQC